MAHKCPRCGENCYCLTGTLDISGGGNCTHDCDDEEDDDWYEEEEVDWEDDDELW